MATPTYATSSTKGTSKPPKSFMKRMLRKLLWGFAILFGLLIFTSFIIAYFFEDAISKRLVVEINKYLTTELAVEEFDMSLISSFPNVAANLRQISLDDTRNGKLLEADNLSFRFGLLSLLSSNVKVKSVIIQDGALFIHADERGKVNYDVVKASESESSSSSDSDMAISLEQARLENIEVVYVDEQAKQDARVFVDAMDFSGQFSADQFALKSNATINSDFIELDGSRFFAAKELSYDADIAVDLEKGNFNFTDVILGIESNTFKVDGTVNMLKKGTQFDLKVTNEDGNLESIVQLLPTEYLETVGELTSTGNFLFNAAVEGLMTDTKMPSVQVTFGLRDGKIKGGNLNDPLKDVSFTAWFSNGKYKNNESTIFEIRDFKGYFNRELTEMRLKVLNLDDPKIDFKLDGTIPLAAVHGFLNMPSITDGDGEIEIKNLSVKGRYKDMLTASRIARVKTSGTIEFDDAELTINDETMLIDRGDLLLNGNDLKVKGIEIEGAGSDISLNGDFYNLIPVLFADSLNSKQVELEFSAQLESKKLDIDRLIALTTVQVEEDEVEAVVYDSLMVEQTQERERFTNYLKGSFEADIEEFNYNKIEGESFLGNLVFDNNELQIDGEVKTMDGAINLEGRAYFEDRPRLKTKLTCKNINAKSFFYQTENFGQDILTDRNLKGVLNANISINAYWDEEGNMLMDKLRVLAGVSIKNGELLKFKMLEDFSSVINVKDLRHIKFSNVQNWLEIRKGKLYLPVMFIQSNALNLTLSGDHSFEQDINYNVKVNAGQVVLNKFKRHDSNLSPQKARKKGWFNLYYMIKGNIDDFDMKSSKSQVQKNFIRSDHRRKEIRKILEKEFGPLRLLDREPESWRDVAPIPEYEEAEDESDEEVYLDDMSVGGKE